MVVFDLPVSSLIRLESVEHLPEIRKKWVSNAKYKYSRYEFIKLQYNCK